MTRRRCESCRALLGNYHYEGCEHGRPYRLTRVLLEQCYEEPDEPVNTHSVLPHDSKEGK